MPFANSGAGVLIVSIVLVAVYLALAATWRREAYLQRESNKRIAERVLEFAFRNSESPLEPGALARRFRIRYEAMQAICDQLVQSGYLHHNPKKRNRLYLSPAGVEAMRCRAGHAPSGAEGPVWAHTPRPG
jgi:predicted transcriptional regulator